MSRFLAFFLLLILLHSSSCKVEGSEKGFQHPYPFHKMSIRERMVVEQVNLDYVPGGANDKHDPKPH
ncbi:hypothetical protein MRB53_035755 [Persea americana]|uniref:Uncharacterized protein n=1 Tax=Persea americana TaxID=3435 RepID=A0ACC2K5U3_PERAE|nr:hypothetical protein MRB53_035755 [Persea americana]